MAEDTPTPKPTKRSGEKTPNDALIEHADRLWNSECENSSRIASRVQLLAGAVFVLIGLSTFGSEWFYYIPSAPICPIWVTVTIHFLLGIAVILLAITLAVLYAAKEIKPAATSTMELNDDDIGKACKAIAFSKTYLAYVDLKERNAAERIRLRRGEAVFAWAIGLTFLAILFYIFGSLGAKISPAQDDNDKHANTTQRANDKNDWEIQVA
jgi:uncharacterized membrane protein (DUF485 family)